MKQLTAEEKYHQMIHTPVESLILRLSVPTIISMLITTVYNLADTFFVGKLDSTSASGAVGVAFSLMAVIQAVGFYFGQGSGNNVSRELGNHNQKRAEELVATGFFCALLAGLVIMAGGLIFLDPLALALGSTDTILPYARDYIRVILLGAPFMAASLVLNNLLRFQGNAFYAMIGLATGGILNIALDPILIFGRGMGIAGAAWATIISQTVSFFILLYQVQRAGIVKIRIRNFKPTQSIIQAINNGGLPSLLRQGITSVATICLNVAAKPYEDAAIAAMGIVSRIAFFTNSVIIGFGQGFQPVCGYNYGAKRHDRVMKGFWFCVKCSTVFLIALAVVEFFSADFLVRKLRDGDPKVVEIGAAALKFQCLSVVTCAWIIPSNMMMQTTGKMLRASFLGTARQGIFLIPLVLLLPQAFGIVGLQLAQPIADLLTLIIAIPMQLGLLKEMKQEAAACKP